MKIAVTGAAGFIGSHVCEALAARGDEVIGVDSFNDGYDPAIKARNAEALRGKVELIRGDLLDGGARDALLAGEVDVVVHLAAWAGVRSSIAHPRRCQRNNFDATHQLLDAIGRLDKLPKLVLASSSSVYGNNKKVPFNEDDLVDRPISPYAATKRASELLAYTWHHLHRLDVTCLRFFTVYGPRQRPDLAIHKFAKLMRAGEAIPRYGDGSTARDYTYVDDIVHGVTQAVDRCAGFNIYNLGNSSPVTLNELIEKLGLALGVEPRIDERPMQPGDVNVTYADIARAARDLDYAPQTSLDDGLARFATWLASQ